MKFDVEKLMVLSGLIGLGTGTAISGVVVGYILREFQEWASYSCDVLVVLSLTYLLGILITLRLLTPKKRFLTVEDVMGDKCPKPSEKL